MNMANQSAGVQLPVFIIKHTWTATARQKAGKLKKKKLHSTCC